MFGIPYPPTATRECSVRKFPAPAQDSRPLRPTPVRIPPRRTGESGLSSVQGNSGDGDKRSGRYRRPDVLLSPRRQLSRDAARAVSERDIWKSGQRRLDHHAAVDQDSPTIQPINFLKDSGILVRASSRNEAVKRTNS